MLTRNDFKKGETFIMTNDYSVGFMDCIKKGTALVFVEMNDAYNCRFYLLSRKKYAGFYDFIINIDLIPHYVEKLTDKRNRVQKNLLEC